ncbi:MAG: MATE family efflux transporter [Treponema sp. GWB1_62_6]|nr:MAG: MATE family efflux transporter [Treponema sp. GWA1_62_8]OHE65403.1 MAG: MATE family efflux transporter [Treponema sp. GWB1_62_6]OHE67375.1 MAG: MATE family efflux transporter [Treponema sp. GWC1_61_84]OHE76010.1 MAG: MATE family efflux transporter [Treponema sp. RIFOXYC1_FULL_61_9]HCM27466.1 MATE family efflux transporter [Treponema sp.]
MKDLTTGNETKLLIMFAVPMLIGNVFQQFYNMVDSWVVGRYVGTDALAAVGASFPILFFMVALMMGFAMGSNILIAQYFGAKNMAKVRAAIDTTYLVIFWASVVLTLAGLLAAEPILRLLRLPETILPLAARYLRIIFGGLILMFGYNGVSAVLRGLGDSTTPLYMLILSTLLNIVLDLVFVRVFGWGIEGVAWATVIAQGVSFIGSLVYLNATHEVLRTNFLKLRFDNEIFKASLKIGLPSGLQQTLVSLGIMFMSAVVNGFGTTVIAGFAAASRIDSFVGMPAMNIGMALSTFTGQNLGAGKPDRARRGYHAAVAIGMGITAVLVAVLLLFGEVLVGIFTTDPAVIAVGVQYLSVIAPFYFAFTLMFVTNGLIRGSGEAIVPLVSTLVAMWLVRIPCAVIFSSVWGLAGIWWSMPTGWILGMAIAVSYYRSGRWTRKSLAAPKAVA